MRNSWRKTDFEIRVTDTDDGTVNLIVQSGEVRGRYGIDERNSGHFVLTHLASGWKIGDFVTVKSAKWVAQYFDDNYGERLDAFKLIGNTFTGFADLKRDVEADKRLVRFYNKNQYTLPDDVISQLNKLKRYVEVAS